MGSNSLILDGHNPEHLATLRLWILLQIPLERSHWMDPAANWFTWHYPTAVEPEAVYVPVDWRYRVARSYE